MGKGIVRHFLTKGFPVTIIEANAELAQRVRQDLQRAFDSAVKAGKLTVELSSEWMSRLVTGTDITGLGNCDLVIETVPENLELKKTVLASIEMSASSNAIISSNTSALPITALAAALSSPSRFVGTHFFNPPHVMPLVEVVRGADTVTETVQLTVHLLSGAGKRPIVVKDCPGFLVNRMLGAYINEALHLLEREAGITELEAVVEAMGFPMGPVKLGDMVGWDVIHASNRTLATSYGERFAIPPLLVRLDSERRFGVKTAKGLFDHATVPPKPTDDLVPTARNFGSHANDLMKNRITYAIIAEALRCLDEGVASKEDIDLAMILGAGLPRGPLAWADEIGCEEVLSDLESLSESYGSRFWPAPVLRICVLAGRAISGRR